MCFIIAHTVPQQRVMLKMLKGPSEGLQRVWPVVLCCNLVLDYPQFSSILHVWFFGRVARFQAANRTKLET